MMDGNRVYAVVDVLKIRPSLNDGGYEENENGDDARQSKQLSMYS